MRHLVCNSKIILHIKFRFTCGKSNLHGNAVNCRKYFVADCLKNFRLHFMSLIMNQSPEKSPIFAKLRKVSQKIPTDHRWKLSKISFAMKQTWKIVFTKYLAKSKNIKKKWLTPKNSNTCFCVSFDCYYQKTFSGREFGHQPVPQPIKRSSWVVWWIVRQLVHIVY